MSSSKVLLLIKVGPLWVAVRLFLVWAAAGGGAPTWPPPLAGGMGGRDRPRELDRPKGIIEGRVRWDVVGSPAGGAGGRPPLGGLYWGLAVQLLLIPWCVRKLPVVVLPNLCFKIGFKHLYLVNHIMYVDRVK